MKDNHPLWIRPKINPSSVIKMNDIFNKYQLNTVCNDALCPNRGVCFAKNMATFLILGQICTRNCAFCSIKKGVPPPFDLNKEINNIIKAIKHLRLKHVVITSVTRDDLPGFGSIQYGQLIKIIKKKFPKTTIEVLIPDFQGEKKSLLKVIKAGPDVLNHNVETVPSLYKIIRPKANFLTSLNILALTKRINKHLITKSGLMVGLGETFTELNYVFKELKKIHCDIVTVGQYLQPTNKQIPVRKYYQIKEFAIIKKMLKDLNFDSYSVGPLVRSSFNAKYLLIQAKKNQYGN